MNDPRYIPPSDREAMNDFSAPLNIVRLKAHAVFMDERDARQRELIVYLEMTLAKYANAVERDRYEPDKMLCNAQSMRRAVQVCDATVEALDQARGVEATNE